MDIRIMQYYLTIVRKGTISAAADTLYISQPALSRQIRDLEADLGVTTVRSRAEEMVHLMQQTEKELTQVRSKISGDIYIGAGEACAFRYLSQAAG